MGRVNQITHPEQNTGANRMQPTGMSSNPLFDAGGTKGSITREWDPTLYATTTSHQETTASRERLPTSFTGPLGYDRGLAIGQSQNFVNPNTGKCGIATRLGKDFVYKTDTDVSKQVVQIKVLNEKISLPIKDYTDAMSKLKENSPQEILLENGNTLTISLDLKSSSKVSFSVEETYQKLKPMIRANGDVFFEGVYHPVQIMKRDVAETGLEEANSGVFVLRKSNNVEVKDNIIASIKMKDNTVKHFLLEITNGQLVISDKNTESGRNGQLLSDVINEQKVSAYVNVPLPGSTFT